MPSAADLPSPAINTIEAIRARIQGDDEAFHDAIGSYLEDRELEGYDTLLACGALLRDAYGFGAFVISILTAEDRDEAFRFLDAVAIEKMAESWT